LIGPIKIVEIELESPLPHLTGLAGYVLVQALVRLSGVPVGYVRVPVSGGACSARSLAKAILNKHATTCIRQILRGNLHSTANKHSTANQHATAGKFSQHACWPSVTVAVCTRGRPDELARCLCSLAKLDYPDLEVLVVDNQPATDSVLQIVRNQYPQFRYVEEPRAGLSWARNRAILESASQIIAFTDDDAVVDSGWLHALVSTFAQSPEIAAVTGLIAPLELETEAQILFELYGNGGFGLGFERTVFRYDRSCGPRWTELGTARCGAGANMAFRRSALQEVGLFDTALGAGTICGSGEDVQMFFRILNAGHTIVYEPSALVYHRHRAGYSDLRRQIAGHGGITAYYAWGLTAHPDLRASFLKLIVWHFLVWHVFRLIRSVLMPSQVPAELLYSEMRGALNSLVTYKQSQRQAKLMEERFGAQPLLAVPITAPAVRQPERNGAVAVRHLDIAEPIHALIDVQEYSRVSLYVRHKQKPLGMVDIANKGGCVGVSELIDNIVGSLAVRLIEPHKDLTSDQRSSLAVASLLERFFGDESPEETTTSLPDNIPVTIVVPTANRSLDLRACLTSLRLIQTRRAIETIVVNNSRDRAAASHIVAEFPGVQLVHESRPGASYARNAGIAASSGEIIVFIDDDTCVPPDWLERLIAPFVRADVMAVSGNILPRELEHASQRLFESYGDGGLNRGYVSWDADSEWFYNSHFDQGVPVWLLGGTGNVAFRASAFCHPKIGLMDECVGPGTPAGIGEDMYLFYRTLRAGWTIVYEPAAALEHSHRRTMPALRRQLFRYGQGAVAYQLLLVLREFDLRAIPALFIVLPAWHSKRICQRLIGRSSYPIMEILAEIAGNLCGPVGLLLSYLQVLQRKRSEPYIPPSLRTARGADIGAERDRSTLASARR